MKLRLTKAEREALQRCISYGLEQTSEDRLMQFMFVEQLADLQRKVLQSLKSKADRVTLNITYSHALCVRVTRGLMIDASGHGYETTLLEKAILKPVTEAIDKAVVQMLQEKFNVYA